MCYHILFSNSSRGKSESGDIDVLITHPSFTSDDKPKSKSHLLKNVVLCLQKCGLICDTISHGDVKFMVRYLILIINTVLIVGGLIKYKNLNLSNFF